MASNVTKSEKTSSRRDEDFEKDLLGSDRSLFWVILSVIWFPFKVVLYPFIWVGRDFRRMLKFLTNRSAGPMDYEEIALVESVPVFFTLASIDIAIIFGIIASISFSDKVANFIDSLTNGLDGISNMVSIIVDLFVTFLSAIYDLVVKVILGGTWSFITSIHLDPTVLLILAIVFSVGVIVVVMVISELDVIGRVMRKLGYFGLGIAELPYAFYETLDNIWTTILKTFGRVIASGSVKTKTRIFYRKILLVVSVYALWIFVLGMLILGSKLLSPNFKSDLANDPNIIYPLIGNLLWVIFLSGILAGTALMFVLSRVLKMISKNRYEGNTKEINEVRHNSLLDFITPKSHLPYLSLSNVSRIVDIPKAEIGDHFKDKMLNNWVLSGNAIVNDQLYKERLAYVEELVDKGLEDEDVKKLTKAIDYLTFMEKGLRNVSEYVDDIEERKELINEDIADVRGLYNGVQA